MKRQLKNGRQRFVATLAALTLSSVTYAGVVSAPSTVNVSTQGSQYLSEVVSSINGDSLILWNDFGRGGYSFLRRFDSTGLPIDTSDWFAGSGATNAAMDKVGNFAIASVEPDGAGKSVFVTVYNRSGTIRINKFKVSASPSGNVGTGRLSFNSTGQLLVGWQALRPDGLYQIYARTYSAFGSATSAVVAITPPSSLHLLQDFRIDNSGRFIAVWLTGGGNSDVYFQRFSNNGTALTLPVLVNTTTVGAQSNARLAMNSTGNFVVTWESTDGSNRGVYAQRFTSQGAKLGAEFRVNDATQGDQTASNIVMTEEGHFAVSWITDNRSNVPGSTPTLHMKQYRADGTQLSSEQLLFNPASGTTISGAGWYGMSSTPAGLTTIGVVNSVGTTDVDVVALRYLLDTQTAVVTLTNGVAINNVASPQFGTQSFKIDVPSGKTSMTISVSGPAQGNVELYGKLGAVPTTTNFEVRSINPGNTENVLINNIPAGAFYFSLYGAAAYSGVTLKVTYQ